MTTAIVYASKHGATAEVARRIADGLSGPVALFDLDDGSPDVTSFETVILGVPIYAGQPVASLKAFIQAADLAGQRLGLFVCGMEQDPAKRLDELATAFPDELRRRAVVAAFLGGRFQFKKMNPAERFIIKRIAKTKDDVDGIDEAALAGFVAQIRPAV
jgi:menaquinone-dependent protoporphyrinogen oxidase